jgi:hypothetical protein
LYQFDGSDPVGSVDPSGMMYYTYDGVVGVRWNYTYGVAEVGLLRVAHPDWVNWLIQPCKQDQVHPVRIDWKRLNSLPQQFAGPGGLQLLATLAAGSGGVGGGIPIQVANDARETQEALAVELQTVEGLQQAIIAGQNAAGVTGLGPTGDGLLSAAAMEVVGGVIQARAAGRPTRVSNPKHHPNSPSPEPADAQELFEGSIVDENGVRWAKDKNGVIHRFSKPSNGQCHWNGSTAGSNGIKPQNIPASIRKALK